MKQSLPDSKKIVFLFLLVGFVWLFLSDWVISLFTSGEEQWGPAKGILLLAVMAGFLYFLLVYYNNQYKISLQQQQEQESQFRKFYEESPQPTWISSNERGVLFMNKTALKLFGYSGEQRGGGLTKELQNLEEDDHADKVQEGKAGQKERRIRNFYSKSGEQLFLDLIIHNIDYENKPARLVVANNVTSLIQAEKDKQRINNELYHYKKALDRSALLSVTDLNGVILDVNNKFCEISKFSAEELIGSKHNLINSHHHPTSYFQGMYKTIRQGKVWRGEVCNKAKDGKLFWVDMSVIPVMDQFNAAERYMAISYPVTDRKAAEIKSEKVQKELMTFMYKASHNLRGPVATLSGLLNIAKIEVKESNSLSYINMLNERTRHLEYTLMELIDITKIKQEDISIQLISFERLVRKVLGQFKKEIERNHFEIQTEFQYAGDWKFRSDPKLIVSLLHYLIDNSIKFRSNELPCISIIVREQAGGVLITLSDNGPGIDEEIRSRVYDMYFRGNEKSTGSGLGLYIVNSIVERLNGYINLQSKPGKGASFVVFLPDAHLLEDLRKSESNTYLPDKNIALNQN